MVFRGPSDALGKSRSATWSRSILAVVAALSILSLGAEPLVAPSPPTSPGERHVDRLGPSSRSTTVRLAPTNEPDGAAAVLGVTGTSGPVQAPDHEAAPSTPTRPGQPSANPILRVAPRPTRHPIPTPSPAPSASAPARRTDASTTPAYSGANHVWIPSLRISKPVHDFPCARSDNPDNLVYTWGCAGQNNVYLLGHAYGVFKPLHDAYYDGRLKKGMRVIYADAAGTVRTYGVSWCKLTPPTPDAEWAWDALPTPGMTLQTCIGAHSELRLMVRLDLIA